MSHVRNIKDNLQVGLHSPIITDIYQYIYLSNVLSLIQPLRSFLHTILCHPFILWNAYLFPGDSLRAVYQ